MQKFDILITDHIAEEGLAILQKAEDANIEVKAGIKNDELKDIIGNYDAVITRSGTTVTPELLEKHGKLKVIGRAGVGLDNVDIEAASKKGIIVMNAPTGNTLAACELTMGMMMTAVRKIPAANQSLKANEWDRKRFMGIQLYNRTLGIVGLGRIGSNVAIRCKAFGMKVLAFDPYIKRDKAEKLGVELVDSLEDLLPKVDVITFHTPLTQETRNMITEKEITLMKDNVVIVNCARGGIVNEDALYHAVKSGKVFSAAVDVFIEEPVKNHPLFSLENVFVTPHIGANTDEGQKGVAVIIADNVLDALRGKSYQNAVNIPFMKAQLPEDMQRYFELSEKMAKMAAQLTPGRPQEVKITMVGKNFENDFCERTFDTPFNFQPFSIAAMKGYLEVAMQETVTFISAPYFAKDRGIHIDEVRTDTFGKYNDLIVINIKTDQVEREIAGTVYPDKKGRIVRYDNFRLDLVTEGTFLYFRNIDKPGMVGRIGTVLGNHNINIAGFELGRIVGGEAIGFVSVDTPLTPECLKDIRALDGIVEARSLHI